MLSSDRVLDPNASDEGQYLNRMSEEEMFMHQFKNGDMDNGFGAGLTEEELALLASSPEGVEMLLA
jgi:hypothetical protein